MVLIHYTTNFVKKWKKIRDKKKFKDRIDMFQKDPFDSRLKTHKLKGSLGKYWSFSLSYQDRVLFGFMSEKEVIFYDFGSHSIYR